MQITGKLEMLCKSLLKPRNLIYVQKVWNMELSHQYLIRIFTFMFKKECTRDGPSTGVGMVTSIISAITEIPVNKNVAMTGRLRGD